MGTEGGGRSSEEGGRRRDNRIYVTRMWKEVFKRKETSKSGRGCGRVLGEQRRSLVVHICENEHYNELSVLLLLNNKHFYF